VLINAARQLGLEAAEDGTYAATQGPRLETAAEIDRLEKDGCSMVGMTAMPEAALARELGLCYASCAVIANWAAGRGTGPISMEAIEANLVSGMASVRRLLETAIPMLEGVAIQRS
jgi:purine nucleoside phosphorylase